MAFTVRNLSVLAYANGFTLWHYKTPVDSVKDAMAPGYFQDAADLCAEGDMIMITGNGAALATIAGTGRSITLQPLMSAR